MAGKWWVIRLLVLAPRTLHQLAHSLMLGQGNRLNSHSTHSSMREDSLHAHAGDLCGYPHVGSRVVPHFWDDCGLFRFFPHRFVLPPTVSRPVHSPNDFPIVLLNPHAQAGNGMVSLTQELGTVISCCELEGGMRGMILMCVCFPYKCWESISSPSAVCKFMFVLLIDCGLCLCFSFVQD